MNADIFKCNIAVGGDVRNVYHATGLTWPEINIMTELHGENSVSDIVVTHTKEIVPQAEFERIRFSYPAGAIKNLYPGVSPNLKWVAPDYIEREAPKPTQAKKPENAPAPKKHDPENLL